jgi:hypothetical protein
VGSGLLFIPVNRSNSQEELIPSVVLAGRSSAPARKRPIQQLDVRNRIHFHPSPVGKRSAARSAHLIPKKLDGAVVNCVIVRLDNARFTSINKPNEAPLLDR